MNRPFARNDRSTAARIVAIVRDLVAIQPAPFRRARWVVAEMLGITERRVRAFLYEDVSHVSAAEAAQIEGRQGDALLATIGKWDAERAAVIARYKKYRGTCGNMGRAHATPCRRADDVRFGSAVRADREALS